MHPIDKELKLMLSGDFDEAWEISESLEELGPEGIPNNGKKENDLWLRHSFNRGWFLLQKGDYQTGCQLLENGRYLNVYGGGFLKTAAPIWDAEKHPVEGKTIILSLEGGYGDEIIHARYATHLKNKGFAKVYIAASPELISVFKRIEGVDGVIQRNEAHTIAHDYWVPGFSAGWVCGNDFDTIWNGPYIQPNPESLIVWKEFINTDKKFKVGIRWAGNPKFEHQQFRVFPSEYVTSLNRYNDIQFYSFQRDENTVELSSDIVDLQHILISWEDTLAALAQMDLVITSCTSIAHAAASMGIPTWVITPILPYHTWAWNAPESNTSPYYGSVKLYRQQKPKEWKATFDLLYSDLEKHFDILSEEPPVINETKIKLNLGCGFQKLDGFINVDISDFVKPDVNMDLMQFPWNFADNSVDHIVAKDILEHVGKTPEDFINVIKEMYRISSDGAAWEVQFPHHRSDLAYDDPTHVRRLTQTTFKLFDQNRAMQLIEKNHSESPLSIEYGVDIEVCEVKHDFTAYWADKINKKEITEEELTFNLNTLSNVAMSVIMLIQVHKPGRYKYK